MREKQCSEFVDIVNENADDIDHIIGLNVVFNETVSHILLMTCKYIFRYVNDLNEKFNNKAGYSSCNSQTQKTI